MCGRYFFHIEQSPAFSKIHHKMQQQQLFEYASDEVFPSQNSVVMLPQNDDYSLEVMKWGVESYKGTLLINARSESIEQKKTFQPMLKNRCLIPCNGFFEWIKVGSKKQKVFIRKENQPLFYLAGIYNQNREFVIVTGEAENEMKAIHKRTPIILKEEQISLYLQEQLDFEVDNENLYFEKEDM